jgi:hypothetical protein
MSELQESLKIIGDESLVYGIRDLKLNEQTDIIISDKIYKIKKTSEGYYQINDLQRLYTYTIENDSEQTPTTKTQDNNSFNAPIIFSPIREIKIEDFLSKIEGQINYISHKEASITKLNVFQTTYDKQSVYIKLFHASEKSNGLLYEQQIYNYLKTRDARIKKIYKNYFIEMIDIFKIEINLELQTTLAEYIDKESNPTYKTQLETFKTALEATGSVPTVYFLITKNNNTESLFNYIELHTLSLSENDLIEIVFEMLYAIYLMNIRLKIRHNDLHFNNVMIKKLDSPQEQEYRINSKIYKRNKIFQIYIYDFDMSFLDKHQNEYLKGYQSFGISSNPNNSHDMWTLIMELNNIKNIIQPIINTILDILLNKSNLDTEKEETFDELSYNATTAKQLFKRHQGTTNLRYYNEFCANLPRTVMDTNTNKPCVEPIFEELFPDVVIERYIREFNQRLNFTSKQDYQQKYLKIKQKYLKLKQKIYYVL